MMRTELARFSSTCRFANLRCGCNSHRVGPHLCVSRFGDVDEIGAVGDAVTEKAIELLDCLFWVKAFLDDLSQRCLQFAGHLDCHASIAIIKSRANLFGLGSGVAD